MKQKVSLASSTSILIGVVIAILALLRGSVQTVLLLLTFALWGLWVVVTLLRPAWRANSAYRCQEERAAREQGEPRYLCCAGRHRTHPGLQRARL